MNELLILPSFAKTMASRMAEAKSLAIAHQGEKKQLAWEDLFRCRRKTTIDENGIASIHVYGMLGSKWDPIYKLLGLVTDYDDLTAEASNLAEDKRCVGVFLDNESGGGFSLGCNPAAKAISALAAVKPVLSYTDYVSASACYYLGCGASAFYASRDAISGSIGTRMDWLTWQGYLEEVGIKAVEFAGTRSTLKHVGTDLREPTEEEAAFLQASIDQTNEEFISHVKASRPGINEEVFKAGYYSGAKALELGLIDAVATRQEAYDDLLALARS